MNIRQLLAQVTNRLEPVAADLCAREAEELLERVLHVDRTTVYLADSRDISESELNTIERIVAERLQGVPLAYAIGKKFFHSVDLVVTSDTLIPRPDTETLVELVLTMENGAECCFLDIGTGPGTIIAALLANRPGWHGYAVDNSLSALNVARQNLAPRCKLFAADLVSALKPAAHFDFIVSNPPYISAEELNQLDASVKMHEPLGALYGGLDGLDFYRRLLIDTPLHLKESGRVYFEIGHNQEREVQKILQSSGWRNISFHKDLAGRPRVVTAVRPHVH